MFPLRQFHGDIFATLHTKAEFDPTELALPTSGSGKHRLNLGLRDEGGQQRGQQLQDGSGCRGRLEGYHPKANVVVAVKIAQWGTCFRDSCGCGVDDADWMETGRDVALGNLRRLGLVGRRESPRVGERAKFAPIAGTKTVHFGIRAFAPIGLDGNRGMC